MSSGGKWVVPLTLPSDPRRGLLIMACIASILTLVFIALLSALPLFDASPRVFLSPSNNFSLLHTLASATLRWDAFHFAHIAKDGYTYDYEWAFFPGTAFVMRNIRRLFQASMPSSGTDLGWDAVLLGGLVGATLSALSVLALYDLTLHHLGSSDIALLASLLSLLPSSPVTLRIAGYSESFFTLLSYQGMLFCARSQWELATCAFALAGIFRSNGIFLCGFIVWGLVLEPVLTRRNIHLGRVLYAVFLSVLTFLPFLHHEYTAYRHFCADHSPVSAVWCDNFPPAIYPYIQSEYWNVGFLRYWTVQQLPNILVGSPPLILLFAYTSYYIRAALIPRLHSLVSSPPSSRSPPPYLLKERSHTSVASATHLPVFLRPSLAPHVLHAFALALLLLFASHTQIVLRLAAAMPLTYWAAAWLLVEHPALGQLWVGWSVVWGAISCITWAGFLPPA